MTFDGRNRFAILSIRVLILHEISRLLLVLIFALIVLLDRGYREGIGERERDERTTERKRARTDGTMVVLPDVVDAPIQWQRARAYV